MSYSISHISHNEEAHKQKPKHAFVLYSSQQTGVPNTTTTTAEPTDTHCLADCVLLPRYKPVTTCRHSGQLTNTAISMSGNRSATHLHRALLFTMHAPHIPF